MLASRLRSLLSLRACCLLFLLGVFVGHHILLCHGDDGDAPPPLLSWHLHVAAVSPCRHRGHSGGSGGILRVASTPTQMVRLHSAAEVLKTPKGPVARRQAEFVVGKVTFPSPPRRANATLTFFIGETTGERRFSVALYRSASDAAKKQPMLHAAAWWDGSPAAPSNDLLDSPFRATEVGDRNALTMTDDHDADTTSSCLVPAVERFDIPLRVGDDLLWSSSCEAEIGKGDGACSVYVAIHLKPAMARAAATRPRTPALKIGAALLLHDDSSPSDGDPCDNAVDGDFWQLQEEWCSHPTGGAHSHESSSVAYERLVAPMLITALVAFTATRFMLHRRNRRVQRARSR